MIKNKSIYFVAIRIIIINIVKAIHDGITKLMTRPKKPEISGFLLPKSLEVSLKNGG